jgi:hypothetical protein
MDQGCHLRVYQQIVERFLKSRLNNIELVLPAHFIYTSNIYKRDESNNIVGINISGEDKTVPLLESDMVSNQLVPFEQLFSFYLGKGGVLDQYKKQLNYSVFFENERYETNLVDKHKNRLTVRVIRSESLHSTDYASTVR